MAVSSVDEKENCLPVLQDDCAVHPKSESQLPSVSPAEVPSSIKTPMCLDSQSYAQNPVSLKMEIADAHASYVVDIDVEKGELEPLVVGGDCPGNAKSEDLLTFHSCFHLTDLWQLMQKVLQKEMNFHMGGKLTQLLMNHSIVFPKFTSRDKLVTDRVYDATNKVRKYKRSASFNSRRVVLLFSVMSSMGSIILIYLTLRARQIAEGSLHV